MSVKIAVGSGRRSSRANPRGDLAGSKPASISSARARDRRPPRPATPSTARACCRSTRRGDQEKARDPRSSSRAAALGAPTLSTPTVSTGGPSRTAGRGPRTGCPRARGPCGGEGAVARHHDHAGRPPGDQRRDLARLLGGIAAAGRHQSRRPAYRASALQPVDHLGEERVAQLRARPRHHVALGAAQGRGRDVAPVAQRSSTTSRTRFGRSGSTWRRPVSTFDTVAGDTAAARATDRRPAPYGTAPNLCSPRSVTGVPINRFITEHRRYEKG